MNIAALNFASPKVKTAFLATAALFLVTIISLIAVSVLTKESVALEVNGQTVSKDFFDRRVQIRNHFYSKVSSDSARLKTAAKDELDEIIGAILAEQELKRLGYEVTDDEVEEEIKAKEEEFKKQYSDRQLNLTYSAYLSQVYKMTMEDQRYVTRKQLVQKKLESSRARKHLLGIWLARRTGFDTEEETIESNTEQNVVKAPFQKREVSQEDKDYDAMQLEKAKQILKELESGADFAILVEKYSEDPISKANKGDLGWFPNDYREPDESSKKFAAYAPLALAYSELGNGQAKIIDYPIGYSIIKVIEVEGVWPYISYEDFVKRSREKADIKIYVKTD